MCCELSEDECKTLSDNTFIVYDNHMQAKHNTVMRKHLGDKLYNQRMELTKNTFENSRKLLAKCNCEVPERIKNIKI